MRTRRRFIDDIGEFNRVTSSGIDTYDRGEFRPTVCYFSKTRVTVSRFRDPFLNAILYCVE